MATGETLRMAHEAIDRLFARLIEVDPKFLPSKSGQPWAAIVAINTALNIPEPDPRDAALREAEAALAAVLRVYANDQFSNPVGVALVKAIEKTESAFATIRALTQEESGV